jgi:hypothetical protein
METSIESQSEPGKNGGALCAECLEPRASALVTRHGAPLCQPCADTFYLACTACRGLIPRDETAEREGSLYCLECLAAASVAPGAEPLAEAEMEALVAEFVALHAEEKKISARLDEIKAQLKTAADGRPRVAGAVILRAGEQAVKCGYSTRTNWSAEKLGALEAMIGAETLASLFDRKISFTPIKEQLEEFLTSTDETRAAAREAIRAAAEVKEQATLTVVMPKQSARKPAKPKGEQA